MPPKSTHLPPMASFRSSDGNSTWTARGLEDIATDPAALESSGRWAVVMTFEGELTCARFSDWSPRDPAQDEVGGWRGPDVLTWESSLDEQAFKAGVEAIRGHIAAGDVYQVNLCRVLSAELPDRASSDPAQLARLLSDGNPAPYGGFVRLPGLSVATASPELFLTQSGSNVTTGPIKGTGATEADISDKDRAENVMIVDLMRNDLGRICRPGTVHVTDLLELEHHPGLVQLVSRVAGQLQDNVSWSDVFQAMTPAGSVSGAPKHTALQVIADLEPVRRGPYCGIVGWVDANHRTARLAVGIRTFWLEHGEIRFGTGAGITWGSNPTAEWQETVLKSRLLTRIAGGRR